MSNLNEKGASRSSQSTEGDVVASNSPNDPASRKCTGLFVWGTILIVAVWGAAVSQSWFVAALIFRFLRLLVAIISFHVFYSPIEPKTTIKDGRKTFRKEDGARVVVIIPTVDPFKPYFLETVRSILAHEPRLLVVVLGGPNALASGKKADELNHQCKAVQAEHPRTKIRFLGTLKASKREQLAVGIRYIQLRRRKLERLEKAVEFIVFVDDHVFWPHDHFLNYLIAPFEDPSVAIVGTNKRGRRSTPEGEWSSKSLWNLLGCLYLERHNFEIRASTAIPWDHGVFVVSGRTQAHRAELVSDEKVLETFVNEPFFFGTFGPLNADDDNYWTRFYSQMGKRCAIQHCEEAVIETELGEHPKFFSQLIRWARTTFRSNPAFLRTVTKDFNPWTDQLWSVYSVYIAGITNFALLWDPLLIWTFLRSEYWIEYGWLCLFGLISIILGSKLVKPFAHYRRHPGDVRLIPVATWLFAYVHSLVKFWAMITFWDVTWSGRKLESATEDDEKMQARINELVQQAGEEDDREVENYQDIMTVEEAGLRETGVQVDLEKYTGGRHEGSIQKRSGCQMSD